MTITTEDLTVDALTLPGADLQPIRSLLARHANQTAQLLFSLQGPSNQKDLGEALAATKKAAADAGSEPLEPILRRVTVSGAVHAAANAARDPSLRVVYPHRLRTAVGTLLVELAAARLLPEEGVRLWQSAGPLPWPAAGVVFDVDGPLRFLPGDVEVGTQLLKLDRDALKVPAGVRARRVYLPVSDRMVLAAFDANPLLAIPGHPEGRLKIGLGDRPVGEWLHALGHALALIEAGLPQLRAEMDELMQQWVPVGFDPEQHRSLSTQGAVGTVYLSLHPKPLVLVEAMVHEYQHNKLHALLALDPLLDDGFSSLHRSPVRPDPRPLHGILLAAHALVPVVELFLHLRANGVEEALHPSVARRIDTLARGNREAIETLERHGRFTAAGRQLMTALARFEARQASLLREIG